MLENHCAADGIVFETNHNNNCQNERKQRGEFEPIYCLFIFLKSWCNLLAHVKTDNGFVHVRICIVTHDQPFRTQPWLWNIQPDGSAAFSKDTGYI